MGGWIDINFLKEEGWKIIMGAISLRCATSSGHDSYIQRKLSEYLSG